MRLNLGRQGADHLSVPPTGERRLLFGLLAVPVLVLDLVCAVGVAAANEGGTRTLLLVLLGLGLALTLITLTVGPGLVRRSFEPVLQTPPVTLPSVRRPPVVVPVPGQVSASSPAGRLTRELVASAARRNQALVARQVACLDQLTTDAGGPLDVQAAVWRLGELATQLRRNGESLLVVAGVEPERRTPAPMSLSEVVAAATAEIENGSRITTAVDVDRTVQPHLALPLVHLLAELLENAVGYAFPASGVQVYGEPGEDGVRLRIEDSGPGFSDADLERANQRLRAPDQPLDEESGTLGLYVVGRLAQQLPCTVQMSRAGSGGVSVSVNLPHSAFMPKEDAYSHYDDHTDLPEYTELQGYGDLPSPETEVTPQPALPMNDYLQPPVALSEPVALDQPFGANASLTPAEHPLEYATEDVVPRQRGRREATPQTFFNPIEPAPSKPSFGPHAEQFAAPIAGRFAAAAPVAQTADPLSHPPHLAAHPVRRSRAALEPPPDLNAPELGRDGQSAFGRDPQPGLVRDSQAEFGRDPQPGLDRDEQVGSGQDAQPGLVRDPQAEFGRDPQPGLDRDGQVGFGQDPQPGLDRDGHVGFGQEPQPGLGRDSYVDFGQDPQPGLVGDGHAQFGQDPQPGLVRDGHAEFGQDPQPGLGKDAHVEFGRDPQPGLDRDAHVEFGRDPQPGTGAQPEQAPEPDAYAEPHLDARWEPRLEEQPLEGAQEEPFGVPSAPTSEQPSGNWETPTATYPETSTYSEDGTGASSESYWQTSTETGLETSSAGDGPWTYEQTEPDRDLQKAAQLTNPAPTAGALEQSHQLTSEAGPRSYPTRAELRRRRREQEAEAQGVLNGAMQAGALAAAHVAQATHEVEDAQDAGNPVSLSPLEEVLSRQPREAEPEPGARTPSSISPLDDPDFRVEDEPMDLPPIPVQAAAPEDEPGFETVPTPDTEEESQSRPQPRHAATGPVPMVSASRSSLAGGPAVPGEATRQRATQVRSMLAGLRSGAERGRTATAGEPGEGVPQPRNPNEPEQ